MTNALCAKAALSKSVLPAPTILQPERCSTYLNAPIVILPLHRMSPTKMRLGNTTSHPLMFRTAIQARG